MQSPLWPLLITFSWQELRKHPWRNAAAVVSVMLGVALAFAVHVINASALDEFAQAVRSVGGQPDLSVQILHRGLRRPDHRRSGCSHRLGRPSPERQRWLLLPAPSKRKAGRRQPAILQEQMSRMSGWSRHRSPVSLRATRMRRARAVSHRAQTFRQHCSPPRLPCVFPSV